MASRLAPGTTVIDVGANVGNHTLFLACVVGARVVAYEPDPKLAAAMSASVHKNAVEPLVERSHQGSGGGAQ